MKPVTHDDITYKVSWHHVVSERYCECRIHATAEHRDDEMYWGDATAFVGDVYSKESGRRVTLTRALNHLTASFDGDKRAARAVRTAIWAAYHGRTTL